MYVYLAIYVSLKVFELPKYNGFFKKWINHFMTFSYKGIIYTTCSNIMHVTYSINTSNGVWCLIHDIQKWINISCACSIFTIKRWYFYTAHQRKNIIFSNITFAALAVM